MPGVGLERETSAREAPIEWKAFRVGDGAPLVAVFGTNSAAPHSVTKGRRAATGVRHAPSAPGPNCGCREWRGRSKTAGEEVQGVGSRVRTGPVVLKELPFRVNSV